MKPTQKPELTKALEDIDKLYGKGAIQLLGSKSKLKVEVIPSGSLNLDIALGVGGFPRGRVIEIFGPECLDGETFVHYEVRANGNRSNHKGGTIARLYERFHGKSASGNGQGKYQRSITENAEFFAPSVNEKDRIFQNKILDVVQSGKKDCYLVETASGQSIVVTQEHRFKTEGGYLSLKYLGLGSRVYIHNNTPFRVEKQKDSREGRVYIFVKNHAVAPKKEVRSVINRVTKEKKTYTYHRVQRSRLVVEASMNGLQLDEYIVLLNSGKLKGLVFLQKNQHVHHKDENPANDVLSNLEVISPSAHGKLHATERHNNLRFICVADTITGIVFVGERDTYDLKMAEPHHNFIANKFVVHNSGGKTTMSLHVIAEAQKMGGQAAFIDAEHALDPVYARKIGVDVDNLLISQPDNGEQALEIAEVLIKSGVVDIIVIDSVAALVPKAELEGSMGDPQMGLQARLMSQALRKLTGITSKSKTCLIFINQIRDKIGVMFGSPETTTGGRALKFYASQRLRVSRTKTISAGDVKTENSTKAVVAKNKVAPPYCEAEYGIIFGEGIDRCTEFLEHGVTQKLVEKSGSHYSYNGQKLGQGADAARQFLRTNPEITQDLEARLRAIYFPRGEK